MAVIKSGSTTDQADVTPQKALKVDGSAVTQPVSIAGTVPISGAVTANIGTTNGLALDATLTGGNAKVQVQDGAAHGLQISPSGAAKVDGSSVTQPISAAALPLPAGAAQEAGGNLAAIAAAMTNGTAKTQTVSGSGVVADVQPKATQGANGITTQDFKDSGRVIKILQATFTPTTTEGMVTLTPVTDGTPGTAGTSFGVTAGKRFRLQAIMLNVENTTAAIRGTQVIARMSASGAVTVTSPVIGGVAATTAAATLLLAASQAQSFPDGVELSGSMQVGISAIGTALAGSTVSLIGYEY